MGVLAGPKKANTVITTAATQQPKKFRAKYMMAKCKHSDCIPRESVACAGVANGLDCRVSLDKYSGDQRQLVVQLHPVHENGVLKVGNPVASFLEVIVCVAMLAELVSSKHCLYVCEHWFFIRKQTAAERLQKAGF